jgi:hypothetical protein
MTVTIVDGRAGKRLEQLERADDKASKIGMRAARAGTSALLGMRWPNVFSVTEVDEARAAAFNFAFDSAKQYYLERVVSAEPFSWERQITPIPEEEKAIRESLRVGKESAVEAYTRMTKVVQCRQRTPAQLWKARCLPKSVLA